MCLLGSVCGCGVGVCVRTLFGCAWSVCFVCVWCVGVLRVLLRVRVLVCESV